MPRGDASALRERLVAALSYANDHLGSLGAYEREWQKNVRANEHLPDQIVAETALLCYEARAIRDRPAEVDRLIEPLCSTLVRLARTRRTQVLVLRAPQIAPVLGLAHVLLDRMGFPDASFDAILRGAVASSFYCEVELRPYRQLEEQWIISLLNATAPELDSIPSSSILDATIHPIYLTREDTYALTHSVFHATSFGRYRLPDVVDPARLREVVDACLGYAALSNDLDLLGELLIASSCLGGPPSMTTEFGWKVLEQVWETRPIVGRAGSLESLNSAAEAFRTTYHPTYVGGILCAVSLRLGTIGMSSREVVPARGEELADLVQRCRHAASRAARFCGREGGEEDPGDSGGCRKERAGTPNPARMLALARVESPSDSPWACALAAGSPDSELTSSLYDSLLTAAARRYDLSALNEVIRDVIDLRLPVTSTVVAAAEFALRQQLPSGAVGAHFLRPENVEADAAAQVTRAFETTFQRLADYCSKLVPLALVDGAAG